MKIVDTHQHLWDLDLFRYAWLEQLPVLNRSFRMNDYRDATSGLAIENQCTLRPMWTSRLCLKKQGTSSARGSARQPPRRRSWHVDVRESNEFRTYLEEILGHPKLKGIRRVLHTQHDDLSQSETFIENVHSLAGNGLSFDICVLARQLPLAIRFVSRLSRCDLHPRPLRRATGEGEILDPWRSDLREIANFPNVFCKISGLIAYADRHHWTAEDPRPYVDHAVECFGWDRVMFGSDWPFARFPPAIASGSTFSCRSLAARERQTRRNSSTIMPFGLPARLKWRFRKLVARSK